MKFSANGFGYAEALNSIEASSLTEVQALIQTFTGVLYANVAHGPLVNLTRNQTLPVVKLAALLVAEVAPLISVQETTLVLVTAVALVPAF